MTSQANPAVNPLSSRELDGLCHCQSRFFDLGHDILYVGNGEIWP